MQKILFSFLLFLLITGFHACLSEEAPAPDECGIETEVSFSADIVPLITTYCSEPAGAPLCHHSANNTTGKGSYDTYDGVVADIDLIDLRTIVDRNMPPDYSPGPTSMEDCEVALLQRWIEEGAADN